ncbi:hypothetical protein ACRAWF_20535 [Streptomyces sp. L7]
MTYWPLFAVSTLLVACFPRLGAAPPHLVHRTGRGHPLRLSAARISRRRAPSPGAGTALRGSRGRSASFAVTVVAAAAVTALCAPPVRRAFRFAMEPEMRWAFRRDATELARSS